MSVAKAPPPSGEAASRSRHLFGAARGGFLAWLPLALGGQLLAWTAYAVTGAFRPWSWAKVGLLNTIAVTRVQLQARAEPPPGSLPPNANLFGASELLIDVALGTGTVVAVVLLFRAGSAAARTFPPGAGSAVAIGSGVGAGFALPIGVSALLVTLRLPSIDVGLLRPVVWQAFVFPLALGLVVAGMGALSTRAATPRPTLAERRAFSAARGAWHGLVWALLLALLGSVILATLRPSASTAYARWLEREDAGGAMIAMYHALLTPNQSVDVLTIAMGACVDLSLGEGTSRVCLDGIEVGDGLLALLVPAEAANDGARREPFGPGYLAFLLVPALATVAGGRRAAEGAGPRGERVVRAAWAGVAFGALVGVAAWAATLAIAGDGRSIASLGADPVEAAALGVVWGIAGGAVGSLLPDRAGIRREPPIPRQGPEGLPSETSVK